LPLLDEITETARMMGAANTLWYEGGRLHGDNTDAAGFLGHLDDIAPGWQGRVGTALLLGAGGAARAIAYGLKTRGVRHILVANRSAARAAEFVAALGAPPEAADWSQRDALVARADLIVSSTSLGMKGQPPLELDLAALRPGTILD